MAILVRLDEMLHARRMTLTELASRIDKAIRFSTLEAICVALECQPGELLAFDPSQPSQE
jgi:putative transcriptional regulator